MLGYCFLRNTKFAKAFLFYGRGRNGKSVLVALIRVLMGEKNCSSMSLHELVDTDKNRFAAFNLYNKMVNTYGDLRNEKITNTERFKSLASGDTLNAEQKFRDPFSFKNYAKMIFSSNTIPESTDKSYAYYRRWVLIHFKKVFDDENDDRDLTHKLTNDPVEMSGMVNFALDGLNLLAER